MARSKRLNTHPQEPSRAAVRRRTTENPPPEPITGDLNEPPPVSGENPMLSGTADEGSSRRESPRIAPSPRASTTSIVQYDPEALQTEEEERRLEEEYLQRKEAIRKRREEAERRRKEEAERIRKEEEKKFEEDRKRAEAEIFTEEETLQQKVEEEYQDQYFRHQFETVIRDDRKKDSPIRKQEKRKGMVTRSTVTTTRKTPAKKAKKPTSRRGKHSEPSPDSSRMEAHADDSQPQIQHPQQSTVGTGHAPSGVPRQFTSPEVAAHYECIAQQKLKLERGFDPEFVQANSFVKNRIEAQDWSLLAAASRRANASLVREFYAEASQAKKPTVTIRGKPVSFSPAEINRVLGRGGRNVCEFTRFFEKLTPEFEDLILKEIAVEGKPWNLDGQRRCLNASSLTTEAAVWFLFLRTSLSPTSHDTTLSVQKCALLYCILTGKQINVGMVMNSAIDHARTRKKVNLPLPCLITMLMIDAGVPSCVDDQWFASTSNINVQTIRRMGRHITTPPNEPEEEIPTVGTGHTTAFIAEEHDVRTPGPKAHPTDAGPSTNLMTEILAVMEKLKYRMDLMEAQQRYQDRATNSFWMYTRERDEVMGLFMKEVNPELAAQLPTFPEDICATYDSEDDVEGVEAESSPSDTLTP